MEAIATVGPMEGLHPLPMDTGVARLERGIRLVTLLMEDLVVEAMGVVCVVERQTLEHPMATTQTIRMGN